MLSSLLIALAALTALAADEQPPWPQENGPFGNFNPRQYGLKLVDDPAQIKLVWTSEDKDLGMGRAGVEGFHRLKFKVVTPGTSTGLILAEGKVFASSSYPSGTVWAENFPGISDLIKASQSGPGGRNAVTAEQIEAFKLNSRIDADDFTIAIDTKTGKTVWKSVEAGKGINVYPGKRGDMHNTPAYYQGRVFSLGTTGLVYAYDAATGKKLWEDATGSDVKPMAALKAKLLKDRNALAGGMGKAACPVVAGGVLIVPQYGKSGDIPLRGMDVATGKTLWETADPVTGPEATPAVWTHQDKQYLVVGNLKGELRLVDPTKGKVAWKVTDLSPLCCALTTSAKHAFVLVNSKTTKGAGRHVQQYVRICAYRITPEKAERAWEAPDEPPFLIENWPDSCSQRKALVRDGLVYNTSTNCMSVLREETGEPLYTSPPNRWSIIRQSWLIEDRMVVIPSPSHRQSACLEWWTLDPKDFRQIGAAYWPQHARADAGQLAAGYDVHIELPYADGFFYMRGYRGDVICYDLRRPTEGRK
jgi:outer membrane protein assembly factor BamB